VYRVPVNEANFVRYTGFWCTGVHFDVSWNAMAYFPARDTYLRTMNYKILTDSFVTRHKLCKMRIIESSTCIFCEEEDDDLNHAIIECPVSRLTWDNMQSILADIGVNAEMNKQTIIFGVAEGTRYRDVINAIMINIKNRLASPWRLYFYVILD
jgi:hypothetical protein